jgi:hypothetical protein
MAGKGRAQGGKSGGFRHVALDVFNPDEWRQTLVGWRDTARATGNYGLLFPLLPYLMGAAKQEINVSGQIEHVKIADIREAIGIVDIRTLNAPRKASGE